jgi:lactoylglutathione lyase
MFTNLLPILYVEDIDRALTLYRDVFAMKETYRFPREGTPEHVELKLGNTVLGLTTTAGLASHHLPPATKGNPSELSIGCDDTDAAMTKLRAAGCTVLLEPFDSSAGNRVAYVLDADGHRIQLYSAIRSPA